MASAELSAGDWSWEPTVVVGLCALIAVYMLARGRGLLRSWDDVSAWLPSTRWRAACFAAGTATLWVALLSPIDHGGDLYLLSIHMVQHLMLMMIAPPLLLLGIVGLRTPPVAEWRGLRSVWRALTRPWSAALVFNAVLLVWHIPALYNTTLTVEPLHIAEHLSFIAAGVVLWWPIVDPVRGAATRTVSPLAKVGMLTVAGLPPTLLGLVFCLGSAAFYDFYVRAPRLWGISALTDQQVAGVIMFGAGNLIYFVAISIIFLRMFEGAGERDEADVQSLTGHVVRVQSGSPRGAVGPQPPR